MLKTITLLLTLLILAMPARAEMYQWVDQEGTLHITPDSSDIPERYRKGARIFEGTKDTSTMKGQIAFVSNRDGNLEIYRMDADGSHVTRLTNHPAADQSPAWSPDGQSLAFMSERDGNWEIYVMDADGSHVRNLTNDPGSDGFPTWSPDGRRIAFASKRAGISEIYVMDRDGSHVKRLTHTGMDAAYLAWSPDGGRIALVSDKAGNSEIYAMNPDGSNLKNLTNSKIGNWHPAWSSDGKSIVFVSDREGPLAIYRMATDGSQVTRLTRTGRVNLDPVWSPDGKNILFASDREGPLQLYVMNGRGFDVTRLTRSESRDVSPAWTPSPRSATFPVEALYAPSDGRDWWIGYKADVGAVRNIEFVLPGERVENWHELVSFQFFGDPAFPSPQAAMEGLRALMKERCQTTVWNVLRQDENSALYEWRSSDCPGQPDQHEIARFLRVKDGTYRIAYVAKTKEILSSRRNQWIELLWQAREQETVKQQNLGGVPRESENQAPTSTLPGPATSGTAGQTLQWGPRYATPGVELTLQEVKRQRVSGKMRVDYTLLVSGFPEGKSFTLWAKPFGSSPILLKQFGELYVDPSGKFVAEKKTLRGIHLSALDYSKGEPYEVALISTDQTIKAFAKVIPIPVATKEGRCRLWMELVSANGTAFAINGEGFEPDEGVTTTSRSDGEVMESKHKASPEGKLFAIVFPAVIGKPAGSASYTVVSRFCSLTVEYEWGARAFIMR